MSKNLETIQTEINRKNTIISESERLINSHRKKIRDTKREIAELTNQAAKLQLQERIDRVAEVADIKNISDAEFNFLLKGLEQIEQNLKKSSEINSEINSEIKNELKTPSENIQGGATENEVKKVEN